jgi:DNA polymerase-1
MADRVILIDGSALFYRAFFAIPGTFTTSAGVPTNATYGFALMFKKLLAGRTPSHGVVVFDAPGKTFREERYPEYKAQRPSMPRELVLQKDDVERVVRAHRYPVLRIPGVEADDVIGTLARRFREQGSEVIIVSGDKDFAQLIGDGVRMLDTLKDVTYDAELVRKKWGVPPEQFVDYLALVGDSSDNIPGVPGIGAKGAKELLDAYGSLDEILAHAQDLTGKKKTALVENADLARMSRDLARIDTNVDLEGSLDDLALSVPDPLAVNALYRELEFFSLLSREDVEESFIDDNASFRVVREREDLTAFLSSGPPDREVSVVVLHDPPSAVAGEIAGFALSDAERSGIYVPVGGPNAVVEDVWADLMDFLADPKRKKIVHDAKALMNACRRMSGRLEGIAFDTRLASFLIDPTRLIPHELELVVKDVLHRTLRPRKSVTGSGQKERAFTAIEASELVAFACDQADAVRGLAAPLRAKLDEEGHASTLFDVDLPLSELLSRMELHGILVDPESLARLGEDFGRDLATLEAAIFDAAGHAFNIGSTKQLSDVLFEELKLPVIKKTKSGYSTDAEVLERLVDKHPIAGLLLEHRKLAKLINTYTDVLQRSVLQRDGRVHATFEQTVGATGRLITTEPDLQRTPTRTKEGKRIRQAFVAPPAHMLIVADWSQIELRLLAHVSGDAQLVDAFTTGADVHRRTAGQIFQKPPAEVSVDERNIGKTINFATIYGQGATALAAQLKIPRKDAERYIASYFEAYAGVRRWLDETMATANTRGFVETYLGRRRYIPELRSNAFMERMAGERIAANTPIQGSAADICKLAMLQIDAEMREAGLRARMILQVHDELVFEVPVTEVEAMQRIVRERMENVVRLRVPLVADVGVGPTWADAKA